MHYSRQIYALQRKAVRQSHSEERRAAAADKRQRRDLKRVRDAHCAELGQLLARERLEDKAW